MARVDDLLAAALRALPAKPADDANQAAKKRYSEQLSEVVAQAFAEELRLRDQAEATLAEERSEKRAGATLLAKATDRINDLESALANAQRAGNELRTKVQRQAEALSTAQAAAERRNIELDALHYVWCDGGCESGVHRYGEHPPLTKEIVEAAQKYVQRLTRWWNNSEFRALPIEDRMSYHAIKTKYLERLRTHRELDHLTQGVGWENNGETRGCAVGCTLEAYDHARYPIELGIPEDLARLQDAIFEGLPRADALAWPEQFLGTIREGADLSLVWPRFALWLLAAADSPMRAGASHEFVRDAVAGVAALYRQWVATGTRPTASEAESAAESAEERAAGAAWLAGERDASAAGSAALAAASAAWVMTESAAESAASAVALAAESAEESAAAIAAWIAAWQSMRDRLLVELTNAD